MTVPMQPPKRPIWTTRRRVMGNVLPSLFSLPFGIFGVARVLQHGVADQLGIAGVVAFPIVGWWALNLLGLYQNSAIRAELGRRLNSERPPEPRDIFFVGVARAAYRNAWDPHEDVAFLIVHEDALELYGEKVLATLPRAKIDSIRTKPNPHSLLGLGGWIVVRGSFPEKEWRIECREKPTLLGNRLLRSRLKRHLETWLKKQNPEPKPGAIATRSDAKP